MTINWDLVPNFKKEKFPEDPDKYADPELIYTLQGVRSDYRKPIYLSPVKGALARLVEGDTSRHCAVGRKSDAIDIFPTGIPFDFYLELMVHPRIGGIGIYIHTNGPDGLPWIMFHMDLRLRTNARPLIWIGEKVPTTYGKRITKYRYPQADPKYWSLLNDEKFFWDKQFGIRSSQALG